MIKVVHFVTTNHGKFASMQRHMHDGPFQLQQTPLELIEPQADTAEEVALSKAKQAFKQLQRPLIVDDSSFHINTLGGFPGPYAKYVLQTLGIKGLLHTMKGKANRTAHFRSALLYVDGDGEIHRFIDDGTTGILTKTIDANQPDKAWSELWRIFVPTGYDKPFSAFTADDWQARTEGTNSAYGNFAEWLAGSKK